MSGETREEFERDRFGPAVPNAMTDKPRTFEEWWESTNLGVHSTCETIAKAGWNARDPALAVKDCRIAELEARIDRLKALAARYQKFVPLHELRAALGVPEWQWARSEPKRDGK